MNVHVSFYKNLGRYNLCSMEKDWCVKLFTPYGNISETWGKDDEPDLDDLLPTDVLDLIEGEIDRYLICTSRERRKATIAAIREHGTELNAAWLDQQIINAEGALSRLRERRNEIGAEAEE